MQRLNKTKVNKRSKVTSVNKAMLPKSTVVSPQTKITPGKGVVVSHTEYLDTIHLTQNTHVAVVGKSNGYAINAGSVFTFPWLSAIARAFDKYRFTALKFELVTRNPVTYSGMVYMALDPDTTDPAPTEIQDFMSMKLSTSAIIYENAILNVPAVEVRALHNPMTYAFTKQVSGADPVPNVYTVGRLWVGALVAQECFMELRVSYTVELRDPQNIVGGAVDSWVPDFPPAEGYTDRDHGLNLMSYYAQTLPALVARYFFRGKNTVAIDVSKIKGNLLSIEHSTSDAGETEFGPGEMFDEDTPRALLLDNDGNTLAEYSHGTHGTAHGLLTTLFSQNGGVFNTLADGMRQTFDLHKMLELFPSTRWIVPALSLINAFSGSWTMRVKTEL